MRVPQFEPWLGKEELKEITSTLDSNWISEGPKAAKFSQKLLELIGAKYGVFAPNGTLALYLGLKALGIGARDEVLVPDFTMIASAIAVEMTGATPVFVDVNHKNFQIDLGATDELVNKKTKAVMPVHIYGTVCDMGAVLDFAKRHNLLVIEDAAQAIGVHRGGIHAGNFGNVGCFSFFADKTITTGEGGFVVTNNKNIYKKLVYLRNLGREKRGTFIHPKIGYSLKITDLQAAVGLAQLKKLEKIRLRKALILSQYQKILFAFPEITFFEPDTNAQWIPFRVPILTKYSKELMDYLETKGVEARTFFYPLHKQPAFSYLKNTRPKYHKYIDENFPNSVYAFAEGVILPTFPGITDQEIKYVCSAISKFIEGKRGLFYKYYDLLYKNKDYQGETDMVADLYEKYADSKLEKILEIGSGTGNHTQLLASLGARLTAIDIDAKMVAIAKAKLKRRRANNVRILETKVEDLHDSNFDLALALFNVVTYLPDKEALSSFMKGVWQHLNPGGLFIFDCWNGVAAIKDPPQEKTTKVKNGSERVISSLTPTTDFLKQVTKLTYEIVVRNGKKVETGGVSFNQTLWTPKEISEALEEAHFETIFSSPFMEPDKPARDTDWKIMFCCRKA